MRTRSLKDSLFYVFFGVGFFLTGCGDDNNEFPEVDGQLPGLELISEHIRTLTGYEFSLKGKITDKDGIQSIRLFCPELSLEKTISLLQYYSEPQSEYYLDYAFTIPDDIEGNSFIVKVFVTDFGGRTTEGEILITLDGDYTLPTLTVKSAKDINIVVSEGTEYTVQFQSTDNKGLAYVEVDVPELNFNEKVQVSTEANPLTSYEYSNTLSFPVNKLGTYKMYLRASDFLGNIAVDSCNVLISLVKDYTSMFYVDFEGSDASLLLRDEFGVPAMVKHTANFQYEARCYSKGNTPIRFIVNEDNFNICFGADKDNPNKLTSVIDKLQPIILPESGYYKVCINTQEEIYSFERYIPDSNPLPIGQEVMAYNPGDGGKQSYIYQFGLAGTGFEGAFGFSTNQVYEMTPNAENPYELSCELRFPKEDYLNFTLTPRHPWGWWESPSWRYIGSDNHFCGDGSESNIGRDIPAGTYTFIFDTHLVQGKLIPKNN